MRNNSRIRRPRVKAGPEGFCNICLGRGPLTEDHVPPRGSCRPRRIDLQNLSSTLEVDPRFRAKRHMQDGVKFQTLCEICNTSRLGSNSDPELNRVSRSVAQYLRPLLDRRLTLPVRHVIEARTNRVARAVLGHLLAADVRDCSEEPRDAPMLRVMREFVVDENAAIPESLAIYYWLFPAQFQVILRGIGIGFPGGTVVADFLKYYPIAFMVAFEAPSLTFPMLQIGRAGADFVGRMCFDAKSRVRPDWPERPADNEFLVLNDGVCYVANEAHVPNQSMVPTRRTRGTC